MNIALVCSEFFDYKKSEEGIKPTRIHGGFGYLTRRKAELLAELGHEVHVIAPSSAYALDDGPRASAYGQYYLHLFNDLQDSGPFHQVKAFYRMMTHIPGLLEVLKSVDPDVVQLENVSEYTTTVAKFTNNALYVFQDPWDDEDIRILIEAYKEYYGLIGEKYYHGTYDALRRIFNMRLGSILKRAGPQRVFSEALFIAEKARRMYGLDFTPGFLPNPVRVPPEPPVKAEKPVVTFIARWDPVKRPQVALSAASRLDDYEFHFIGTSSDVHKHKEVERHLREKYSGYRNIHIHGFIEEKEKEEILNNSWVLLNTSAREGLPITFLEAAAHASAIVSGVNPDGWAERFGVHVTGDDFVGALRYAIKNRLHETKGMDAYNYVKDVHEERKVVKMHEEIYQKIISGGRNNVK
ncbi:MAG: glycosyltransferase family 4 protein [Nitrososphaeria archaeon]